MISAATPSPVAPLARPARRRLLATGAAAAFALLALVPVASALAPVASSASATPSGEVVYSGVTTDKASASAVEPVASSASATPDGQVVYSGVTGADGSPVKGSGANAVAGASAAPAAAAPHASIAPMGNSLPFTGISLSMIAGLGMALLVCGGLLRLALLRRSAAPARCA